MRTLRYLVLGGAALAGAACSDLPSWPDHVEPLASGGSGSTPSSAGGSSGVIPAGGGTGSITGGSGPVSSTGGAAGSSSGDSGGSTTAAGGSSAGSSSGGAVVSEGGSSAGSSSGGAGGVPPDNTQADIDDAVKNLKGWRYEHACGYVDGHSLTDGTCNSGEICFPNAQKAHFSEKKTIAIGGTPGKVYDVKLRVRGAMEPRDYPQECTRLPGAPANTIGVLTNCDGYANKLAVTFNIYELKIQQPPAVYYMNGVTVHPPHRVDPIDQTFDVKVAGGTSIDFAFDDLNGGQIRNCSITVEGIQPYPKVFDGNFFQLDVLEAKLAP